MIKNRRLNRENTTASQSRQYVYRHIVRAKLFIDRNFAENIDLNKIAEQAYFSKFHFIRLFKSIYGKTPNQYLTTVRIEMAKELLKKNIATSDVCFSIGFESISSFKGLFKKITQTTPASYRKKQLSLKSEMNQFPSRFLPYCLFNMHRRKAISETGSSK